MLKDTAVINDYLKTPQIKSLLSDNQRYAKFVWGIASENKELGEEVVTLYAIKSNRDQMPPLAGGVVVDPHDVEVAPNEPIGIDGDRALGSDRAGE